MGFIFFPLGIVFLTAANSVKQIEIDYTTCLPSNTNVTVSCSAALSLPAMKAPVYVYYQLTGYYQNHRRYIKSRNDVQLAGKVPKTWKSIEDCLPRRAVNEDKDKSRRANWFLPCGLVPWSRFNDSFALFPQGSSVPVPWRKQGIAWDSDVKVKFKNPDPSAAGTRLTPPVDFEDEDFIVWMRTAGQPAFRKMYRIIDSDLPAGDYSVTVNSLFPVTEFSGTKSLVLSTVSWMGGKNTFLGTAYIVVGIICLLIGTVLLLLNICCPRHPARIDEIGH